MKVDWPGTVQTLFDGPIALLDFEVWSFMLHVTTRWQTVSKHAQRMSVHMLAHMLLAHKLHIVTMTYEKRELRYKTPNQVDIISLGCVTDWTYRHNFALQMSLPLLCGSVCITIYGICYSAVRFSRLVPAFARGWFPSSVEDLAMVETSCITAFLGFVNVVYLKVCACDLYTFVCASACKYLSQVYARRLSHA